MVEAVKGEEGEIGCDKGRVESRLERRLKWLSSRCIERRTQRAAYSAVGALRRVRLCHARRA